MRTVARTLLGVLFVLLPARAHAEDGYELWLRYRRIADAVRLMEYRVTLSRIVVEGNSPTLDAVRAELRRGLQGLLGSYIVDPQVRDGSIIAGTPRTFFGGG